MLAEHNLQRAPCFRRTRGHIPSSQLFDIDAACCAQRSQGQTLNLLSGLFRQTAIARERITAHHTKNGGDGRDRTDDLMLAKQLLSQLSYVP